MKRIKQINIPIVVTLIRIIIIPIFMAVYALPYECAHLVASLLFMLAALTDWLDGYLARTLGQMTRLGAFLDPVADKLLVACVLVILVGEYHNLSLSITATIIVMREIAISALREWMAEIGQRTSVAVSFLAKIKTTIQMIALIVLIAYTPSVFPVAMMWLGSVLLSIAAALTLWTMIIYLKIAWPDLTLAREKQ